MGGFKFRHNVNMKCLRNANEYCKKPQEMVCKCTITKFFKFKNFHFFRNFGQNPDFYHIPIGRARRSSTPHNVTNGPKRPKIDRNDQKW